MASILPSLSDFCFLCTNAMSLIVTSSPLLVMRTSNFSDKNYIPHSQKIWLGIKVDGLTVGFTTAKLESIKQNFYMFRIVSNNLALSTVNF